MAEEKTLIKADSADVAIARPAEFLIGTDRDACRECWGCVRRCPAQAIQVIEGVPKVLQERCVKCGLCVSECTVHGHTVRDDLSRVKALLVSGQPVVAMLATEFIAAMHPISAPEVSWILESIGFTAVESTLLGEEITAVEYERTYTHPSALLMLRSTCPVVVDWVRKFHPQLVPALTPIVPPYIVQARLIKKLYPEGTAVVYVSPCYARKDEIFEPQFAGVVDAAIDFTELKRLLSEQKPRPPRTSGSNGRHKPQLLKEISLTDGFPRTTLTSRNKTDSDVVTVRGLRDLDTLLRAVIRGEAAPLVVDMLNCEGCLDGPTVRPSLSVFAKRNIIAAAREQTPCAPVTTRDLLGYLPTIDVVRSFKPDPVPAITPSAEEIDRTLAEGGFATPEEMLDCGACGHATCVEHALAIIRGASSWEMCFPQQRKRMQEAVTRLEEYTMTDVLTGLLNRRGLGEHLAYEITRTRRYATPVSFLMIDVDGFKEINDAYGHPFGDTVLCAVGDTIRNGVREVDSTVRYGGDEFALILPETTKTEAYAVAEKLRAVLAAQSLLVPESGRLVKLTISVGVATVIGENAEGPKLLEAADQALYRAKQSGRNQVRLAAG